MPLRSWPTGWRMEGTVADFDYLMAAIAAVECIYVSSKGDTKAAAEVAHEHLLKVDAQRDEQAAALTAATARAERAERENERMVGIVHERISEVLGALNINAPGEDAVENWGEVVRIMARMRTDLTAARALLRECLEGREDCDDLTCSTTNRCEFCDLSARIEAHLTGAT